MEGETELDSSVRLFRDTFFPSFRSETRTIIRSFVEKGFQSDVRMCMYAFCEFPRRKFLPYSWRKWNIGIVRSELFLARAIANVGA